MRPHTWSRPKPLLHVAGNSIIGHLLNLMSDITTKEVIFVVGYKGDEIEAWIRQNYPHLDAHFVVQEEALGQAHAIWMCRDYLDDGEALVAFGDGIVDAAYAQIPEPDADGVILVQEMEEPRTFGVAVTDEHDVVTDFIEKPDNFEQNQVIAGIYWFKHGRTLLTAIETIIKENRQTKGEYYLVDAYKVMLEGGAVIKAKPAIFWLDAGNPDYILEANKRLLGLGYGSEDALERSYAEDFTVFPPVFIHETAVIHGCVIGPYVSIGPGVNLKNSVIRNSIVDGGTAVANAILDGALIGENAKITGKGRAIFIGDNSIINL